MYGGSGEDHLYGGGGDDTIWGGFDSDWLEGQNGVDTLYGGSGIDMLVLDTSQLYDPIPSGRHEVFDGHHGNGEPVDPSANNADDNATDILLIQGTDLADQILVGQTSGDEPQLQVFFPTTTKVEKTVDDHTFGGDKNPNRTFVADWRDYSDPTDPNGKPLVEQIRISGLDGDDDIEFLSQDFTSPNGQDTLKPST